MQIPDDKDYPKLNRWHDNSTPLIVQITIVGALSCLTSATIAGFVGHHLILQLAECRWQLKIELPGASFEEATVESDSLTINFQAGGSVFYRHQQAADPLWPTVIGEQ
jgi:hypothetical protein